MNMSREELEQCRLEARLESVRAFYAAEKDIHRAVAAIKEGWNKQHDETDPRHIRDVAHHIRYNVEKLESRFSLLDLKPPGRPPTISNEQMKVVAEIVGSGHWVKTIMEVDNTLAEYLHWCRYTSIREAIMQDGYLGGLCKDFDVDAAYLRRRLHQVDPQLQYTSLPMKDVHSEAVKQQRVDYANDMLFRLSQQPDFLDSVYFMDECRIWVGRNLQGQLMVWSHRGDFEGEPPISNQLLGAHAGFKINLLLVVNARRGVVWKEFLSGTAGMADDDRYNPEMRQVMRARHGEAYKVSYRKRMHFAEVYTLLLARSNWLAIQATHMCCSPSHHK